MPTVVIMITDTRRGGAPNRMAALARAVRSKGWQPIVISVMPGGAVLDDLAIDGIATASLDIASWRTFPAGIRRLRRIVRQSQPAIVQTALWHANMLGRLALLGLRVPIIDSFASLDNEKALVRVTLDRITARRAAAHVAVAAAVAVRVSERERIPIEMLHVIPAGIDASLWRPSGRQNEIRQSLGIPPSASVVVWAGRVHRVKSLGTLVEAVARLPEWWLLVVGDGEGRDDLMAAAADHAIKDRFVMTGEVRDVAPMLEAADVFALPSRWEGMPNSIIEAMASGLPVVAADVGGVPEVVTHGHDGLLVAPEDPVALAAAIAEARSRSDLATQGQATVMSRFSLEAMASNYVDLWRAVARRS